MDLEGSIVKINQVSEKQLKEMYFLMVEFYNNVTETNFRKDFLEKDYCIILRDRENKIKGFSTQKILTLNYKGKIIHGVFSGDTVIHKENWGSFSLFQVFSKFFFTYGKQYDNFYWFLIVKGHKTYKILPTFLKKFYPNFKEPTPPEIKSLMDFFGCTQYPEEYNSVTGVIEYNDVKDSLKEGIADITSKELRDNHVKFFLQENPYYEKGNDLVCIASLKKENLRERAKKILLWRKNMNIKIIKGLFCTELCLQSCIKYFRYSSYHVFKTALLFFHITVYLYIFNAYSTMGVSCSLVHIVPL